MYRSSVGFTTTSWHADSSSGLVVVTRISSPVSLTVNLLVTRYAGRSSYSISASAIVVPQSVQ